MLVARRIACPTSNLLHQQLPASHRATISREIYIIESKYMGFALWTDGERAWAQGTSEYRAMGVAVIAASDLFRNRDFHPRRARGQRI